MRPLLLAPLLAMTSAAAAAPLTIHVGETWVFAIRDGQPTNAHKAALSTAPAKGQVRATVSALGGTTMTLTNAIGIAFTFRAELIAADGKVTATRSCTLPASNRQAFESWPQRAVTVRIGSFKRTTGGSC